MSTDTDASLEARVASIESAVDQIDKRLGRIETEVTALRSDTNEEFQQIRTETREEFRQLRTELRRWIVVLFAGLSLVFTVLLLVL